MNKSSSSANEVVAFVSVDKEICTEKQICDELPSLLNWPPVTDKCLSSMSGGITNKMYKLNHPNDSTRAVIVRIYGGKDIFSFEQRQMETKIFKQLGDIQFSPKLYATFLNGRVEQYLNARPIKLYEMTYDFVCYGVAIALAKLHSFYPSINQYHTSSYTDNMMKPRLWQNINKWIKQLKLLINEKEQKRNLFGNINVEKYIYAAEIIQKRDKYNNDIIVFSHNDLAAGNILVNNQSDDITLIDYEYSNFNYNSYDIANFFCEAMGGTDDAVVRPSLYPDYEYRRKFCYTYLKEFFGREPDVEETVQFMERVEWYSQLSHLHWGFWGLMQSIQPVVDYPYLKYAEQRFNLFSI